MPENNPIVARKSGRKVDTEKRGKVLAVLATIADGDRLSMPEIAKRAGVCMAKCHKEIVWLEKAGIIRVDKRAMPFAYEIVKKEGDNV